MIVAVCCLIALAVVGGVRSQDVVGCGGFVRSKFPVDFTRVQVQLLTVSGVLKYKTDCAPNNGYFLLPLYDKGEFVLKVDPPEGWIFDPSEVHLSVDGKTDKCSRGEDVDFELHGFSIFGQVLSVGVMEGPRGVTISLHGSGADENRDTQTAEEGQFSFEGVVPGEYQLTGHHDTWRVSQDPLQVAVEADSVLSITGIIVLGFDVKGYVFSKGEAVSGVQVLLFSHAATEVDCDPVSIPDGPWEDSPSCAITSDGNGEFVLPPLPPGDYTLVPHYRRNQIVFEVQPSEIRFSVSNDSVVVKPSFEVQGFSVTGRVLRSQQGPGIAGAQVYLDGSLTAESQEDGVYQLFNITTGTYVIQVEAPDVQFDPLETQISPSTPDLPDVVPVRYSVCASIQVSVPPAQWITAASREVKAFTDSGDEESSVLSDQDGRFCAMLSPGHHRFKALVTEDEQAHGLLLQPSEVPVTVVDSPIFTGVQFTQYLTTVSGRITCLETCPAVTLTLTRAAGSGSRTLDTKAESKGFEGAFLFDDVLPGNNTVSINYPGWCWREESVPMAISPQDKTAVEFQQTGYVLECSCSHTITVSYSTGNDSGSEVRLNKGHNKLCVEKPGRYTLRPKSCHQFESEEYTFDTSSPVLVVMAATAHRVSSTILSPIKTDDITLKIRSLRFGAPDQQLAPEEVTQLHGDTVLHAYHFSFMASSEDDLEVIPLSSQLMFSPESRKFTVSEDCPERIPPFNGSPGLIIAGHTKPPLEGVSVIIELDDGTVVNTVTSTTGGYRVGPIHGGTELTVRASLDGYILEPVPSDAYSFTALKLSQITITVRDSGGGALMGVLVSLSGANFRSNNFTGESGKLIFTHLIPGQYYVKPLLREFEFSPSSQVVELREGYSEEVMFTGQRVAFSCTGKVTSLNRQPQEDITVKVAPVDEDTCGSFGDESITDVDGAYKLRGLRPGCVYVVSVKDDEDGVQHTVPSRKTVEVADSDVEEVDFIVVFSPKSIQVTGNVIAEQQYLTTLKLNVFSEGKSLYSVGVDSVGFFVLPPLPINSQEVYNIVLDTNLSPHFYNFTRAEKTFTVSGNAHITMHFLAEERDLDKKPHEGSFVGIISAVALIFMLFNIDTITQKVQSALANRRSPQQEASGETRKRTGHSRR